MELLSEYALCAERHADCEWYVGRAAISGCSIDEYNLCLWNTECDIFVCNSLMREWARCFEAYCEARSFPPECSGPG